MLESDLREQANASSLQAMSDYNRLDTAGNGISCQRCDQCANNECKNGDQEQWDHVTVIGKVGRGIKARLEFDFHRLQKESRKASERRYLSFSVVQSIL